MSAPFQREIEPRFNSLSGFIKESIKLAARQLTPTLNNVGSRTLLRFKLQAQHLIDRIQSGISRLEETDREWISFIHTRIGSEFTEAKADYSNFLLGQEGDRCHFHDLIERGREAITSLEQALKAHLNCERNSAFSLPHQTDNASCHQPRHSIAEANEHTHTAHQASLNTTTAIGPYGITTIQLPQIEPPIFSGDPLQWPTFWAIFEATVHSKPISNAEKMSYLVMFLRNNAKTAINGYHITHDNYPIVIELLKRRFGNQKVIGEILQQELISLPKATNATQSLRTFSDSVERLCRQMRSLQISYEHPYSKGKGQKANLGLPQSSGKQSRILSTSETAPSSVHMFAGILLKTYQKRQISDVRTIRFLLTQSHTSEKTDLFAFDAKIVAVSQETSSKCELAPTEIASKPVTEIIGRLPLSETADSSLPEISKVIEDLPIVGADIKKSDSSHDLRPIYNEQIHMQKNEEIKEHGITNQSPPKYAIHIHLNVQSDKINITLKLLHQPTNAYRKGAENSVIKNLAGTNLRTVASYLLCRGKCVLCFTRLLCRCSRTRTNETSHLSTKMTTEPSLSIRNVTVLSFSNFRTDVSSRPARPPNHFLCACD
ncbi:gag protein [Ditylenchus destructor]|uniref:Gag protein n=2 Tax=Ditylenchus destructor TaxID=166010 RepID=A0AAD4MYG8_9BILA|nr:gag protein [Ditylenchus destructor]